MGPATGVHIGVHNPSQTVCFGVAPYHSQNPRNAVPVLDLQGMTGVFRYPPNRPHNPKVPGSNPGPATIKIKGLRRLPQPFFLEIVRVRAKKEI